MVTNTCMTALIEPDDQGMIIPYMSVDGPPEIAYHLECWLHEIGADRMKPR